MTDWRNETRTCACGTKFKPKREAQRHCSASCRDVAKKRKKRAGRSGDKKPAPCVLPRSGDKGPQRPPKGSEGPSEQKETGGPRRWEGEPATWDGFEGRIRLYLHDEAPRIGSGERGLTVSVEPKRVRLLNHHTGDVAWITRAVFEMLAEKQRGRLAPRDGWLVAPAVLSHASGPEALQLKLVVSNEPKDTRKEQAA